MCKTERSMKQNIKTVYKALKRTAAEDKNSNEPSNKINKKEEDNNNGYNLVHIDDPTNTKPDTKFYCGCILQWIVRVQKMKKTLGLTLSIFDKPLQSTVNSDDEEISPDQDHSETNDILILRAKLLSTEMEVKKNGDGEG